MTEQNSGFEGIRITAAIQVVTTQAAVNRKADIEIPFSESAEFVRQTVCAWINKEINLAVQRACADSLPDLTTGQGGPLVESC